jgi:hypothetical protein
MNNNSSLHRKALGEATNGRFASRILYCSVAAALLAGAGVLQAQPTAHYPPGVHGINAASLPMPGLYVRDYNLFYTSDHLNGPTGDRTAPANFDALTYANIIRPIWITDVQVLGGYLGTDVVIPLVYRSLRAGTFDDSSFGLGDFFAEGTLSWHLKQFDFCFGVGEWMPTGESAPKPTTRAGLGFWATMFTFGGTWFIDSDKTWSISALNRYEISNTEQPDTHTTTGNAWTIEYGLGKKFNQTISAGLAGYYQGKMTGDSGMHPQPYNHVAAIGPEIDFAFPAQTLYVALRYEYEFLSQNRAQGHTVSLVLTKRLF